MGTIKDRNSMDLAEEKILRGGGKNTQKNYIKKIFMTKIIMMVGSHQRLCVKMVIQGYPVVSYCGNKDMLSCGKVLTISVFGFCRPASLNS